MPVKQAVNVCNVKQHSRRLFLPCEPPAVRRELFKSKAAIFLLRFQMLSFSLQRLLSAFCPAVLRQSLTAVKSEIEIIIQLAAGFLIIELKIALGKVKYRTSGAAAKAVKTPVLRVQLHRRCFFVVKRAAHKAFFDFKTVVLGKLLHSDLSVDFVSIVHERFLLDAVSFLYECHHQ